MKQIRFGIALAALVFGIVTSQAQTPSWVPPADNERCPSKWGAGDERGAANHMKPATVLNAVKLVKTGEVIELGHVLNAGMPLGARSFNLVVKQTVSFIDDAVGIGADEASRTCLDALRPFRRISHDENRLSEGRGLFLYAA